MNEDSQLKQRLNNELWSQRDHSLKSDELNQNIYNDFDIYFENKEMLQFAVDTGFLVFDHNFFCEHFKGTIFAAFLFSIIEIYRSAKKSNQNECISFLLAHEPTVSRGFQNTTSVVNTEQHKDIPRLKFYTKVCLRELGDFIEGSFQPFIKELYGLHLLKKKDSAAAIESINKAKLGNAVQALIDHYEDLSVLYKHVLEDVPLHQWRNIAHHNSYSANEENGTITCTYGSKGNEQSIILSRDDLGRIYLGISRIQYLHKIAHAVFSADNVILLSKEKECTAITDDTAIMQSFETLASKGFKVIEINRDKPEKSIDVMDADLRDAQDLETSIEKIIPIIFPLLKLSSMRVFTGKGKFAFEIKTETHPP